MNPMVFTIVVWEREMEMQREMQKKQRSATGATPANGHEPKRAGRESIFAWISRIRRSNSRPASECSQEGCY